MKRSIADAVSDLSVEVFRLNGELLAAGDALVAELGLTSARWQVLGAIALSPAPLPIAHVARNMGLRRASRCSGLPTNLKPKACSASRPTRIISVRSSCC
jgi:hypothetical protein